VTSASRAWKGRKGERGKGRGEMGRRMEIACTIFGLLVALASGMGWGVKPPQNFA